MAYLQTEIDQLVEEVKAMETKEELKLSNTKCPFCKKYMSKPKTKDIETKDSFVTVKHFHCPNCEGHWKYDLETKKMYRVSSAKQQ